MAKSFQPVPAAEPAFTTVPAAEPALSNVPAAEPAFSTVVVPVSGGIPRDVTAGKPFFVPASTASSVKATGNGETVDINNDHLNNISVDYCTGNTEQQLVYADLPVTLDGQPTTVISVGVPLNSASALPGFSGHSSTQEIHDVPQTTGKPRVNISEALPGSGS